MRAYYYDNQDGHQTLPHDSGLDVSEAQLARLGVLYWHIPVPDPNDSNATNANIERIDAIARERDYKNRDIINVTKEGLGDQYEAKLKTFFAEHMHEDEEIRYVEQGSGFFDVRELSDDRWIRIHVNPGDLLVLPAGIYHRFTLDERNSVRAMRLFKDEPKWVPHNRGLETDANEYRKAYVQSVNRSVAASA